MKGEINDIILKELRMEIDRVFELFFQKSVKATGVKLDLLDKEINKLSTHSRMFSDALSNFPKELAVNLLNLFAEGIMKNIKD